MIASVKLSCCFAHPLDTVYYATPSLNTTNICFLTSKSMYILKLLKNSLGPGRLVFGGLFSLILRKLLANKSSYQLEWTVLRVSKSHYMFRCHMSASNNRSRFCPIVILCGNQLEQIFLSVKCSCNIQCMLIPLLYKDTSTMCHTIHEIYPLTMYGHDRTRSTGVSQWLSVEVHRQMSK